MDTIDEIDRKRGMTALLFSVGLSLGEGSSVYVFTLPEEMDDGEGDFVGQDFTGNLIL